ncbi:hypothetical protein HMPREF2664_00150 [Staphylococcus sp. HMSC064E03]|nr:hypothetical protein HMPREF2664_00150 [Staphylococcus sp. HMSC064E03]
MQHWGTTTPSVVHCSQVLFVYKRLNYDVVLCIALFCECKRVDPKLYIKNGLGLSSPFIFLLYKMNSRNFFMSVQV